MIMPLCAWLLVLLVFFIGVSCSLCVLVNGYSSNPLQSGAHASHALRVVGRSVPRDEGCEEGRRHVQGCEVFSNLGMTSLAYNIGEDCCCCEKDIV